MRYAYNSAALKREQAEKTAIATAKILRTLEDYLKGMSTSSYGTFIDDGVSREKTLSQQLETTAKRFDFYRRHGINGEYDQGRQVQCHPVTQATLLDTVTKLRGLAYELEYESDMKQEAESLARLQRDREAREAEEEVSCLSNIWASVASLWRTNTGSSSDEDPKCGEREQLLHEELPVLPTETELAARKILQSLPSLLQAQTRSRLMSFKSDLESLDGDSTIATWAHALGSTEGYVYSARTSEERLKPLWLDLYESKRWARDYVQKGESSQLLSKIGRTEPEAAERAVKSVQALLQWMKAETVSDSAAPGSSTL